MSLRRDEIIETSIKLFNEKGYSNTTTRHIAEVMQISVGNLYYYFKNKEDILIDIFKNYIEVILLEIKEVDFESNTMFLFEKVLINYYQSTIKCHFFITEINTIIRNNPNFRKMRYEYLVMEVELMKKLIHHQIKNGYIILLNAKEVDFFISNIWIIALNNHTYWSILNKNDEQTLRNTVENIYYFLKPYFTKKRIKIKNPDEQIMNLLQKLEPDRKE